MAYIQAAVLARLVEHKPHESATTIATTTREWFNEGCVRYTPVGHGYDRRDASSSGISGGFRASTEASPWRRLRPAR